MVTKKAASLFKIEKSLGVLESGVMDIIWKKDEVTVRETVNTIRQNRQIAYTTVMTVMDNLYKKGFLSRKKVKRSYYYSSLVKENYIITISLSRVFKDLTKDYGRGKVLYFAVNSSLLVFPKIKIFPASANKIITTYKTPVGYGISFTLILTLLGFSSFDLLQNLRFFGTIDYLSLLTSEPTLFMDRLHLSIAAFLESLPIINILTTTISFIFIIVLVKKLSKLLNLRMLSITNLGG